MRAPASVPSLRRRAPALAVSVALALPVGLGVVPRTAAAATTTMVAAGPKEDPALVESRQLYEEGKARFDTFDYEGAVDLWTKAYAKLPEDAAGVRNAMVYNIATAQEKAYGLDKDLQHLRQAAMLLKAYIDNYKALYERTPETEAEVKKAEDRIAALNERIARAERGEDVDAPPPTTAAPAATGTPANPDARYGSGAVDGIEWNTGHSPPVDPKQLERNRRLAAEEKKTDHMLIGSYVALSIGGLFTLGGAGTLLGTRAVGAGYGTLAFGLAGLVTGVTLLAIGLERRKKARDGTLIARRPVMVSPLLGRRSAGAALRIRF